MYNNIIGIVAVYSEQEGSRREAERGGREKGRGREGRRGRERVGGRGTHRQWWKNRVWLGREACTAWMTPQHVSPAYCRGSRETREMEMVSLSIEK